MYIYINIYMYIYIYIYVCVCVCVCVCVFLHELVCGDWCEFLFNLVGTFWFVGRAFCVPQGKSL